MKTQGRGGIKAFAARLPLQATTKALLGVYVVALLMAVLPPLYLASSGISTEFLGVPITILYWIVDALLVGLTLMVLYVVEDAHGVLDEELVR